MKPRDSLFPFPFYLIFPFLFFSTLWCCFSSRMLMQARVRRKMRSAVRNDRSGKSVRERKEMKRLWYFLAASMFNAAESLKVGKSTRLHCGAYYTSLAYCNSLLFFHFISFCLFFFYQPSFSFRENTHILLIHNPSLTLLLSLLRAQLEREWSVIRGDKFGHGRCGVVPKNSKLFFPHRVRAPLQSLKRQRVREREPKTKGRVK